MPHPIHGRERTSDENDSQQGSNERHEEEQQQRPQHDSSARQSHQRLHRDDTNGSDISGGASSHQSSSSSYYINPWSSTSVVSRAAAAAAAALSTSTTEFSAADDPHALRQSASAASAISPSTTARIEQSSSQPLPQKQPPPPQQHQIIDSKPSLDSTDSSWFNKGGPLWKLAGMQARSQVQPQPQHPPQQQPAREEQHYASPPPPPLSPPAAAAAAAAAPHIRQDLLSDDGDQNVETMDDEFQQAQQKQRGQHQHKRSGPGARLAETLMERMRSRADPNAPIGFGNGKSTDYTPPRRAGTEAEVDKQSSDATDSSKPAPAGALYSPLEQQQDKMVRIGDAEDEGFILRDAGYAQKRVRVVQLLIVGLVGLLLGWLGNFFVGTSCHFAAINVQVGQYSDEFKLHFGLWKYSPADSALSGYTYCYPYSGSHDEEGPIFARLANLLALLAGTYSLVVLWVYLITGRALRSCWRWAVWMAYLAGVLQFLTLGFFVGHLCQIRSCQWGPAASLALVTSLAWAALGWELHYQAPPLYHASGTSVASRESRHGGRRNGESYDDDDYRDNEDKDVVHEAETVVTLEMADFHGASQEYLDRAFGKSSHTSTPSPSRQRPPSSASTIATNTTTMSYHRSTPPNQ